MKGKESLRAFGDDLIARLPDRVKCTCPGYHSSDVWHILMPRFANELLGLHREHGMLSPDGSCIGASTFEYCWITFYHPDGTSKNKETRPNTVIVDDTLRKLDIMGGDIVGRYRFTEMHECCHHLMVRAGFSPKEPVKYRYVGGKETPEEREADYLAAYLLMPDCVLTAAMRERNYEPFVSYEGFLPLAHKKEIHRMARELQVSDTALNKRLDDAGWFEYRSIYEFHDPDRPGFDPLKQRRRRYDRQGV